MLWDCLLKDVTEVIEFKNILNMGGNFFLDIFSFFFVKKINNLNVLDNDPSVCFYSTRNTSRSKTLNLHSVFLFSF